MHADYLAKLADAAEDGDWRCALAIAISLSPPVKVAELVSAPLIALRLSRVAMHAGYALNRELVRLFRHEFRPVRLSSWTRPARSAGNSSRNCSESCTRTAAG